MLAQIKTILNTRLLRWVTAAAAAIALLFIPPLPVHAAGETYTYAEEGGKIVGTKGLFGNNNVIFTKTAIDNEFSAVTVITYDDTTCEIGLRLNTTSGSATGSVSAPAFANGLQKITAPGSSPSVESCTKEFAAGVGALNKSISIGGSTDDSSSAPTQPETIGQRQIIATVHSEKKVSDLPTMRVALRTAASSSSNSSTTSNVIGWNTSSNTGSAYFQDVSPGQYTVCIQPANQFSFNDCQSVTKVARQALSVDFGSPANTFNEEGRLVNVVVRINIPGHIGQKTYGPADIVLMKTPDNTQAYHGTTDTNTMGLDTGKVPEQQISIFTNIDGVDPGSYRACIADTELCSEGFTKQANKKSTVHIDISEEDSDTLAVGSQEGSTCAIQGVGWIVCPVASFIGTATDGMYALVEQLLIFEVGDAFDTSASNGLYTAWSNVRNLANIAFIFAFFIIIFSQATSIGIGAYGIKKMLPRLIVAAIMVNLSYFICIFAIDVSNIIGAGIDGIIKSASQGMGVGPGNGLDLNTWITAALAGGGGAAIFFGTSSAIAAGGSVATILGGLALTFGIAALIAVLTALVILIGRQAFLIILVILSPLAFIAYILPNTEGLFDKWRKTFITLLVFYPIVALLFSGAGLAAEIMRSVSSSALVDIFSIGVQAFPLFATPFLLKFSGGLLSRVAGIVNNPNKGPFDRLRKAGEERLDARKNKNLLASRTSGRTMFGREGGKRNAFTRFADKKVQGRDARMQQYSNWEYEAKRAETANSADRLADEEFAAKVSGAGINGPRGSEAYNTAIARTQARGIAQKDKLGAEEMEAAKTILSGLSDQQLNNLAISGVGKTRDGTELTGDFYRNAAIDSVWKQGRTDKIEEVLQSNMSDSTRKFVASKLDTSFGDLKSKGHYLNFSQNADGQSLQDVLINGGKITTDMFHRGATKLSGLNAELVSTQTEQSLGHLEKAINTSMLTTDERQNAVMLLSEALSSNELSKNFTPNAKVIAQRITGVVSPETSSSKEGVITNQTIIPTSTAPRQEHAVPKHTQQPTHAGRTPIHTQTPTAPSPALPSQEVNRAMQQIFSNFSPDDIRNMGAGGVNIYIQNVGGASNLSSEDLSKVTSALGEAGVRTPDQEQLFQTLQTEQQLRRSNDNDQQDTLF